jgi:hypothetical protein
MKMQFIGGGVGYQTASAYGMGSGTSRGTDVTGGTTGVYGSWTQLTASCKKTSHVLLCGGTGYQSGGGFDATVQLGVGAGGSEQVIGPTSILYDYQSNNYMPDRFFSFPLAIPEGSRISVRLRPTFSAPILTFGLIGLN